MYELNSLSELTALTEKAQRVTTNVIRQMAQTAYECLRAYDAVCNLQERPSWDLASEVTRESMIEAIKGILVDITVLPQQTHAKWVEAKIADGWKYSPNKDTKAKTHPDLVIDYNKLSEHHRAKDWIVRSIVITYLAFHIE